MNVYQSVNSIAVSFYQMVIGGEFQGMILSCVVMKLKNLKNVRKLFFDDKNYKKKLIIVWANTATKETIFKQPYQVFQL